MRDSLSVEERLALTLRFLATGQAFFPSAISQAVIETCEALSYVLQDYMKVSQTLKCVLFKLFLLL
jgi:hypothetical protein